MIKLAHIIIAFFLACSLLAAIPSVYAARMINSPVDQKNRLVLMPLRVSAEDRNLHGAMETALMEGLQNKYEVFAGERVQQKTKEIFNKESRTAKKECDETRCMQDIAIAFQAELIAVANVTKQDGGYFLAITIQNIFDNKVVYSKSLPCEKCNAFKVVDKLKELVGAVAQAPVSSIPAAEEKPIKATSPDPESIIWIEVQKGSTEEDYQIYLDAYPKGKYALFAKAKINKMKDTQQSAFEQQEQAWNSAKQKNSADSMSSYLQGYPNGRYASLAKVSLSKFKSDVAAKEEAEQLRKTSSNNKAALEAYPTPSLSGRNVAGGSGDVQAISQNIPAQNSLCGFPDLKFPTEFSVFAAGAYSGRKISFQIDQSGHEGTQMDVAVNNPGKPVVLMLGAYEPTIWNITSSKGTKILAVLIGGYHRQKVAGLETNTPVLVSTYDNQGPCGYFYISADTLAPLNPLSKRVFGRPVDMVFHATNGKVDIGKITPESFHDKNAPLAGQAGLEDAVRKGLLRNAAAADVVAWFDAVVQNSPQRDIPPVAGQSTNRPSRRMHNAYVVLKPFIYPSGLYGAHSATFLIPKGVPKPEGNPGHSAVYDFNTLNCQGPLCSSH